MRRLLKLSLTLFILLAGIYAATPIWLPFIFARQLPPGWQLEKLDAGYPGISGLGIDALRASGELQAADVTLAATDIRYTYRGLKTEIASLSIDVFMQSATDSTADRLTLDDLSFPITKLTGKLPELSVNQLRLSLHTDKDRGATDPLIVDFQAFKLLPDTDNNFHLTAQASIPDSPETHGLILTLHSGGMLTHLSGNLELQAEFAGNELQGLEQLSLATRQLEAEVFGRHLILDFELRAIREGEQVTVMLPRTAKIEYRDTMGKIDELIFSKLPELRRSPQLEAVAVAEIGTNSKFVIQAGNEPSLGFNSDIKLGIHSDKSSVNMQANDLQIEVTDFSNLGSTTTNGEILLNWNEGAPFTYTVDDGSSTPSTIAADEMELKAELTLRDGKLLSTGDGVFIGGRVEPLAISTTRVDVAWRDMDLLNLAGELSTKTQGFTTEYDDETWTGFDFDVVYTLLRNADVKGSGSVKFDSGFDLPIRFAGNLQTDQWNITLPTSTIKLSQLGSLLRVAHFELPESVKLTDGYVDIQGDVVVADEITADMTVRGYEMGASMLESSAREASFNFDTSYGITITANGPLLIEAVALAGGIDVTNIGAELKLESTETFALTNLHAEVFDGQIGLDGLRFSESRIEDTTVELTHINLARLLAFADIDGLEGTGHLDIVLPAGSDQNGIYIKDGIFSSNTPGRLAYTKEGVAGSNIGLQALENFQYQDFSGTINYQSDGAYQIAVRLEGKNPDLYGGHPIVFNLNISGSLPELFEAMFITGDFEEAILNEVRSN